jgi:oligopeptide transport system substrate-binding protein
MFRTLIPLSLLSLTLLYLSRETQENKLSHHLLRINMTQDPSTLDPRKSSDQFSSALHFQLYEGLMRITKTSTAELGMAKEVHVSEDKMTYTFILKDALWSDKTPVTAYDFEYSWKESIKPSFFCPNAHMLYIIKNGEKIKMGEMDSDSFGVKAIDEKTLQVKLEHSAPYFLQMVSFPVFFPVPKTKAQTDPKWAKTQQPPANGPFTCVAFMPNEKIILKKNLSYWAKHEVLPQEIQILLIRDESTALNLYEQKELDLIGGPFTTIPVDSIHDFREKEQLQKKDLALTVFTTFNVSTFPFNNAHIRKAFSLAINRESIVENITQNGESAATTFVPPILKKDNHPLFFSYDPQEAKKELQKGLKELKISSLPPLTYHYPIFGCHDRIAQTLQENFRDILDVEVKIVGTEFKTFLSLLNNKQYQFGQFLWIAMYNDQYSILERFKNRKNFRNYPGWKNRDFANLLEQSETTFDPKERARLLELAEKILLDEAPLTPIYHGNYVFMEQDRIEGFYISPIGSPHLQWITFKENKPS